MHDDFVRKDIHDEQIEHIKDTFSVAVNDLDKRIDDIKNLISWGIGILGIVFVVVQVAIAYFIYYMQSAAH